MSENMRPENKKIGTAREDVHPSHKIEPIPYEVAEMCRYCAKCLCHSDLTGECEKREEYEKAVAFIGNGKPHYHAEIQYTSEKDGTVHSDICGSDLKSRKWRKLLHESLDEWLDESNGTGFFFIGNDLDEYFGE